MKTITDPNAPYGVELRGVIADRIKLARQIMGSPGSRQVAERMQELLGQSYDHNMVLGIEKGKREVSYRELLALAEILEQDYRWLAGDPDLAPAVRLRSTTRDMGVYLRSLELLPVAA